MELSDYLHKNIDHSQAKTILENDKNVYYVVKSASSRNVRIALERNTWATTPKNEKIFDEAYSKGDNVILVFSINGSSQYIGYALMRSKPGHGTIRESIFYMSNGKRFEGRQFDIHWVRVVELPFTDCAKINNSCNDNLPVKVGRDGQEIDKDAGKMLCMLFENKLWLKSFTTQEQLYANRHGGYHIKHPGFQTQKAGAPGVPGAPSMQQLQSMPCVPHGYYPMPSIQPIAGPQTTRPAASPITNQEAGTKEAQSKRPIGVEHALISADYNPAITIFPVDLTNMSYEQYLSLYHISHQYWISRPEDSLKKEEG
ncbi:hypothetical protein X943_002509 [Babesia divergens]|uniref:YTH domain-containing protein n=1 Tax=Babesia divergens TaxID=32595 RepID=A0AAD9LE66_BABDI|nr:hypothetical protein X943_002509 [Babesia divergens]